jgi:hypothetical protein
MKFATLIADTYEAGTDTDLPTHAQCIDCVAENLVQAKWRRANFVGDSDDKAVFPYPHYLRMSHRHFVVSFI